MKRIFLLILAYIVVFASASQDPVREKTSFQTASPWKPATDVRADVAIVYGVGGNPSEKGPKVPFEQRVQSWRDKGYVTHFMTGIAWGEYQDYFTGHWDGVPHLDEGQKTAHGDTIWHGHMVPYIVPSRNFLRYLKEMHIRRVIDAGINAIYMEEPEFWMRAGYSEAFKREWAEYYGFPWRPQHESPENTWLSSKLKHHLYYRALEDVFTFAKEYGRSKGMDVRCYVPTHSPVNYSAWGIVSPEASIASLSCVDGYVAQVWTGTSREPTFYNGVRRERVFENAFLEYGSMESMTRPTGRKMFFLTDPVEDWPRDWADYKRNYQATFVAQLLYPSISDYEVMPWPDRIYEGLYRTCASCETRERIPRAYSTQMQIMINALNDIPRSDNRVSGAGGFGVMMSNSLMFQRYPTHDGYDDPQLSGFYGQALPLLKRGIPVATVHVENTPFPDTWRDLKVLVVSYTNMKPTNPDCHRHIARWVNDGGQLIYCGTDTDPFQRVAEWWNSGEMNCHAPSEHLFETLGLPSRTPGTGEYPCGKGTVYVLREEPRTFVMNPGGDAGYFALAARAYAAATGGKKPETKNSFLLRRGAYLIAAVMDESVSGEPLELKGTYIDLFDPALPVLHSKNLHPGEHAFLYDLSSLDRKRPSVLCGASRIGDEKRGRRTYQFTAKSPADTDNVTRVALPAEPMSVRTNTLPADYSWDAPSGTCLIRFGNSPEGVTVEIEW
jgi:hypothetical protein